MTIVVALPAELDKPVYLQQRLAGLRQQHRDLSSVLFLSPADHVDHYRQAMPGCRVEPMSQDALKATTEFFGCDGAWLPQAQSEAPTARLHVLSDQGRIVPWGRDLLDDRDYPHFESHPFNRYSPRDVQTGHSCLYYFPYGYLNRAIGHGPLNEFGHRIDFDTRTLIDRPSNHIVIVLFGGSAAYSTACTYEQMFSQVMERELNALARQAGSPLKFTVLNYATCGAVVLNEMMTFVLFAARLKPEIVISHSGANDLGYAWLASPFLLGQFDIVYQQQLELWSRVLHEPGYDGPRFASAPPGEIVRPPPGVVIRAYLRRVRQFSTMARGFGASFIWGLQPAYVSKPALSEQENEWIFTKPRIPEGVKWLAWIREFFDLLKRNLPPLGDDAFVDFDELFKSRGSDETLFSDVVHLDPRGDDFVGKHYASVIWSKRDHLLRSLGKHEPTPAQPAGAQEIAARRSMASRAWDWIERYLWPRGRFTVGARSAR